MAPQPRPKSAAPVTSRRSTPTPFAAALALSQTALALKLPAVAVQRDATPAAGWLSSGTIGMPFYEPRASPTAIFINLCRHRLCGMRHLRTRPAPLR